MAARESITKEPDKASAFFRWVWSYCREIGLWGAAGLLIVDVVLELGKGLRVALEGVNRVVHEYEGKKDVFKQTPRGNSSPPASSGPPADSSSAAAN